MLADSEEGEQVFVAELRDCVGFAREAHTPARSSTKTGGDTLTAKVLSSRVSRVSKMSPMPSARRGPMIS